MRSTEKILLTGLIILFITNVSMCSKINGMYKELGQVRSETSGISLGMSQIEGNISNTMQTINQENQWMYDQGYDILNISDDLNNVTLALRWSFRNLDKNSEVFISYGEKDPDTGSVSKWEELPAASSGVLSYRNELTLSMKNNYKFRVIARNPSGIKSGELADLDLYNSIRNRIQIQIHPSSRDSSGIRYDLSIQNQFQFFFSLPYGSMQRIDVSKLKIKNIKMNLYVDGKLTRDFYIYQNGKPLSEFQITSSNGMEQVEILNMNHYLKLENDISKPVKFEAVVEDYFGNIYEMSSPQM